MERERRRRRRQRRVRGRQLPPAKDQAANSLRRPSSIETTGCCSRTCVVRQEDERLGRVVRASVGLGEHWQGVLVFAVRCHCPGHFSCRRELLCNGEGEESCCKRGRVGANTKRMQEQKWNRRRVWDLKRYRWDGDSGVPTRREAGEAGGLRELGGRRRRRF